MGLWRTIHERLLSPLRTAVRAFFRCRAPLKRQAAAHAIFPLKDAPPFAPPTIGRYMALSERQTAEHPGVTVPLRLLRLLLKHPADLQVPHALTSALSWLEPDSM